MKSPERYAQLAEESLHEAELRDVPENLARAQCWATLAVAAATVASCPPVRFARDRAPVPPY